MCATIWETTLLSGNIFFSVGRGNLIIFTAEVPNAIDKSSMNLAKLNESFPFSKQRYDFLKKLSFLRFLQTFVYFISLFMNGNKSRYFLRSL